MIADWMYPAGTPLSLGHLTEVGEAYEMVTDDQPPPDPVPVVITEKNGKVRWTVSIPSRHGLPLRPNTYANICSQAHHIATHVEGMISNHTTTNHGHFSYNHVDGNFMDVKEAEELGLLPGKLLGKDHSKVGYIVATEVKSLDRLQNEGQGKICERSLTYLMQSRDAGFGATLMGLWIAYGLALKEERAFFIDDRDWYVPCTILGLVSQHLSNIVTGHTEDSLLILSLRRHKPAFLRPIITAFHVHIMPNIC